jgi:hypothetical protein
MMQWRHCRERLEAEFERHPELALATVHVVGPA